MITVGVVQFEPRFGDPDANLQAVEALIQAHRGADLYVLPELFCSGYLFDSMEEAAAGAQQIPDGPVVRRLGEMARRFDCALVAGVPEQTDKGLYNSAVVIDPARDLVDVYRKIHLFAEEKRWFRPGDLGYRVWDLRGFRLGVMICFDWMFPETARSLAVAGVHLVAHPSNLVLPYGPSALPVRSLENRVYIACANRTGQDRRPSGRSLTFTGKSRVTSPDGKVLGEMDGESTGVLMVEIDPALAEDKWVTPWNHVFQDIRSEYDRCNPRDVFPKSAASPPRRQVSSGE